MQLDVATLTQGRGCAFVSISDFRVALQASCVQYQGPLAGVKQASDTGETDKLPLADQMCLLVGEKMLATRVIDRIARKIIDGKSSTTQTELGAIETAQIIFSALQEYP